MTTNEGGMRGRRRRAFLVATISSAAALLAAEVVARRMFGVPLVERLPTVEVRANRLRGYEMVPDRDHFTYEHPVHVNQLGLRGPDLQPKGADERRLLCIGDSTTYGQGVADADTIPARLEVELGRAAVRVVNGGVRGYGTPEEVGLFEELGPAIRPDVVVLLWYPNDLERPEIEENAARLTDSGPVAFDTGARMEGAQLLLWHVRSLVRRSALIVKLRHAWVEWTYRRMTPAQIDLGFERLDAELARLATAARASSVDVLVAAIPTAAAVRSGRDDDHLSERVGALAQKRGFAFVDLAPALRELRTRLGRSSVLPYDGHYDGDANAAMAHAIARAVAESFPARL
ncbi:MAG TPA: SGNH/GDSL hydrolase family protein [Planctomycetota bacterium]|jgi:hypothetical protein|nr:SGNH/GDSL hydrolase family protein [Planctomycetota bacterium]